MATPRVAAAKSPQGQPRSTHGAVTLQGVEGVTRTGRQEAAGCRPTTSKALVATHTAEQQSGREPRPGESRYATSRHQVINGRRVHRSPLSGGAEARRTTSRRLRDVPGPGSPLAAGSEGNGRSPRGSTGADDAHGCGPPRNQPASRWRTQRGPRPQAGPLVGTRSATDRVERIDHHDGAHGSRLVC